MTCSTLKLDNINRPEKEISSDGNWNFDAASSGGSEPPSPLSPSQPNIVVRPVRASFFLRISLFFHCAAMTLCNVVVLVYWLLGVVVRSLCFSVLHLQRVAHVMSAAASAFAVFACVFFQPLLRAAARAPSYMPYTRRSERCVSVFG